MTSSNGNIFRVTGPLCGEFPSQRPVTRGFDVSLICALINGWVNNRAAGDLRRHRAHYDVAVMHYIISPVSLLIGKVIISQPITVIKACVTGPFVIIGFPSQGLGNGGNAQSILILWRHHKKKKPSKLGPIDHVGDKAIKMSSHEYRESYWSSYFHNRIPY